MEAEGESIWGVLKQGYRNDEEVEARLGLVARADTASESLSAPRRGTREKSKPRRKSCWASGPA